MISPFRSKPARWSPAASVISDEPEAVRPRGGPSLLFAMTVIIGVALSTAGAVALFFVDPSEGAPEEEQAVAADAAAVAAMTAPNLPVHKVTTKPVQPASAGATASADKQAKVETAAEEQKAAEEEDVLEQHDPRWARSGGEKAETVFASVLEPSASAGESGIAATGALALAAEQPGKATDKARATETAAIAPENPKPKQAAKAKVEKPKEAAIDNDQKAPPGVSSSATRTVQVLKGANMRSRPKGGSSVLSVVPKGASVQLVGCDAWCEIVYKGQRGYVYKDFVAGAGGKVSSAKATKARTSFTVSSSEPQEEQPKQDKAAVDAKPKVRAISSRLQ